MNSAERVIVKFGSQSELARLIGRGQSTVQHWAKSGIIPAKWHSVLLELAMGKNIDLNPSDFIRFSESKIIKPEAKELSIPVAKWFGALQIGELEVSCYVLNDERRVISRNSATIALTEKRSGDFDSYVRVEALKEYLPEDLPGLIIEFKEAAEGNKTIRGIEAGTFLDICKAFVSARDNSKTALTERQKAIAIRSGKFLAACAKIGLIALIDEATGFQYDRAQDALRFKLKLYLEDEMRQWEKTFPDELWREFGRLTNWGGSVSSRPKYWGKLVMELIYSYLDKDVADWLKENAPKPRHGQNYHQWLSSQYGLKKLTEHLWMLIGMASACTNMQELRRKMAERFGRQPIQLTLYLPPLEDNAIS